MRDRSAPLTSNEVEGLAWNKMGGLIPAIVQETGSGRVLMVGYMNSEALAATLESGLATFYSRSKKRQWLKGETSGNALKVSAVYSDCDDDALLVLADPQGPTCHLGTKSCFGDEALKGPGWLADLSAVIADRAQSRDETSYTVKLLNQGLERIAQKVGEEGVELALAAIARDPDACAEEAADLLYHLAVLMKAKGFSWNDVIQVLRSRHRAPTPAL
jgi:phosphoribosyl-ATP pyrophosphohydrolase/phosphoribosyl-AMP cyclohydrolase